jgi:4-amino-4-deoxy-L-arabinose transferase-like glycosyltransferase
MKKMVLAILFLLWLSGILTVYFIVQKPDFFQILNGLGNLLLTVLIPFLMAVLAGAMGSTLLPNANPAERLILGVALGMGVFGLAGFGLVIAGWAKAGIFWIILLVLTVSFILTGKLKRGWSDAKYVARELKASTSDVAPWIPISVGLAGVLTFLLSLAPPTEDFDALLYHLTIPAWWLRDGGITLTSVPPYWFPQIVEGSFIWPMALGFDTATHLIHFTWFLLMIFLLWHWARQLWNNSIAWDTLLILLTMPSLLWLATWAYTDYALVFAGLATLYSLWKWQGTQKNRWLFIGGIMAGIAVSVKYTGFVIPLVGMLLVAIWEQGFLQRLKKVAYFSATTVLVASPWYLRNWIWMKNPLYPFVFDGRFWDSFLAQAYSASGSGIGLDPVKLLTLPLTATLGTQDINFFDGRIGPFILILAPLALWVFLEARQQQNKRRPVLFAIGLFGFVSIAAWTIGVINSASLFQTRMLFSALIPVTIPLALGLNSLYRLDTSRLRVSFIVRSMLAFVVGVNLLNFSLQIIVRNPLAVAAGITSREDYMEKRQPGYASALSLVNNAPLNAKIYFLFEPRSYGMNAYVQPDSINVNFAHDIWLYKTPEKIVESWKLQGYTHVLLSKTGAEFIFENESSLRPKDELLLGKVETLLIAVGESQSGNYVLYKIP